MAHVFLLLDCRHDPIADDLQMLQYLNYHVVPFTAVLTKGDKLSRMKLKEQIVKIAAKAGLAAGNVIATSGETRLGKEEILSKIAQVIAVHEEYAETGEETDGKPYAILLLPAIARCVFAAEDIRPCTDAAPQHNT